MTNIDDMLITIAFGPRQRTVFARELAEALGVKDVRGALWQLLRSDDRGDIHSPVDSHNSASTNLGKKGGKGDRWGFEAGGNERTNERNNNCQKALALSVTGEGEEGCRGEEGESDKLRFAHYLAGRLGDLKSLSFYERVARQLPRETALDALARAVDVHPSSIRRSRAALFTAIVRPHLAEVRRRGLRNQI